MNEERKEFNRRLEFNTHIHSKPSPHILEHTTYNPLTWLRMYMFPEPQHRVNLTDFLEHVEPGDVLLFASDNFYAFVQDFFTGSPYSHVALPFFYDPYLWRSQVRERNATNPDSNADFIIPEQKKLNHLMFAESMPEEGGVVDYTTGTVKDGPMVVLGIQRMVSFMIKYGYRIVWRRLNPDHRLISDEERILRTQAILRVMYRKRKFGFDAHASDLMSAAIPEVHVFPWFFIEGEFVHNSEAYCTQLTSEILMEMKVLRSDQKSKKTVDHCPGDFSEYNENLDYARNQFTGESNFFGPEILVDVDCYDI